MTDVWVFDYVDNTLVQTIHQDDNTAADFGSSLILPAPTPSLLALPSTPPTTTLGQPYDTFQALTVDNSTGSQAAGAHGGKLKMTINDAPARHIVTPATWYSETDGPAASANQAITSLPSNCRQTTFTFSAQGTNVTLAASNGTSTISSVAINNVPIQ